MWEPIGGNDVASAVGAELATNGPHRSPDCGPEAPPSHLFTLASGVLVLALTALWTRHLLLPLLLLPFQPPPWPASVLHPPLAVAASLLFAYGAWLAQAYFLAGGGGGDEEV